MHPIEEPDGSTPAEKLRAYFAQVLERSRTPTPADIVKEIQRRLEAAPGRCLVCPQRRCRRRRRCDPADLVCLTRVMSPAQQAETLAKLNRAWEVHGG